MKKCHLTVIMLFVICFAFGQSKGKQKEKPPTQKEMDGMMKEMQKAMDEMSPEDKRMMDSMGIKMPDMKGIQNTVAGISDAQIQKAYEDENRIVPQKDAARINTALSVSLSNAEMSAFISKTQQAVMLQLSPATKIKGTEVFQQVSKSKTSVANTAVGLWMDGKPTLALYLMGEACKTEPNNAINLNNYAAFLTMCGAQQLALPILNNLNKRYPKNSSILNNIAQAWLGLGDIPRAEKYADSSIRIAKYHPQANMAKCLIEESKGNIPAAIEAAKKAISKSYSTEKENKLKKLGYRLKPEDINWDAPMPRDPMGLEKFGWPDFPVAVEQNKKLKLEWENFRDECQKKIDELKIKQRSLEKALTKTIETRNNLLISESQKGHYVQLMPGLAAKAMIKLGPGVNDINGNMSFVFAEELERVTRAMKNTATYEDELEEKQKIIDEKYEDKIGEGRENPLEAICKDENGIRSEFLSKANGGLESAFKQYLSYVSRRTGDLLYYCQYTQWPEQFELVKVYAQISWLSQIKDQKVMFKDKSSWCIKTTVIDKPADSLQNFDDVACQYVSTMDLGCYKIISSCSNLTGQFDCGGVQIDYKSNVETGRYSGSAIVGVSKGIDGPMGMEAEVTLGGLVEWDNTGFTDAGAIAGISANAAGVNIAGADVSITVNGGVSTSGSNILQGIK